ncbi:MAG TPA: sodium:proton antiporter [Campylobacterales bacterium]|jgi:multicomponent Na+:H+ antiporter subunit C|nr:sodium:proton antiporter [Campylobacterales bacterium]
MLDSFNQTPFLHSVITIGSFLILLIGLIGALSKKNLFKVFLSLAIAESSLFIYFIGMHFSVDKVAPIVTDQVTKFSSNMVDPVPQAMILTTIVIGIAVLSLGLSFVISYYKLTGKMRIDEMDELGDNK